MEFLNTSPRCAEQSLLRTTSDCPLYARHLPELSNNVSVTGQMSPESIKVVPNPFFWQENKLECFFEAAGCTVYAGRKVRRPVL
jgi:hypothetical protein